LWSNSQLCAYSNIFAKRIPTFLRDFRAYPNNFAKESQHFCKNEIYPNIFAKMVEIYDENLRPVSSDLCFSLITFPSQTLTSVLSY